MLKRMIAAAILVGVVSAPLPVVRAGSQAPPQQPSTAQPSTPPLPPPMPAILKAYAAVTTDRLKQPAAGDWLMVRRTYDGWNYSPLDQITPQNANRLQPLWVSSTGATNGHEAPPLVNRGVMFVSTPGNR